MIGNSVPNIRPKFFGFIVANFRANSILSQVASGSENNVPTTFQQGQ